MSFKRVRVILLTGMVLIVLVITAGLILTYGTKKTTYAPLPQASASVSAGPAITSSGATNNNGLNSVSVTTGNVQAVIATLSRPVSYTRSIRVESFYGTTSAVYKITATVNGNDTAMKIDNGGDIKHVILAGGKLYIWYEGDKDYLTLPAEALGSAPNLSDEFQKILTYEDILKPDVSIQDASLEINSGEQSIHVRYISGSLKYVTTAWISVSTGLLVSAEQYDSGRLIYSMTTADFKQPVPDNSAFKLPDGKSAR